MEMNELDASSADPRALVPTASVAEYFHDAIASAIRNQRLSSPEGVPYYLGNLLVEFTRRDRQEDDPFDEPLALRLGRALDAPPEERLRILKRLGDIALFVAGFFSEALNRGLVDVEYYIGMGESAYGRVGQSVHGHLDGGAFQAVFLDLGRRFGAYVEVLAEVSESHASVSNEGLLRLYECWARTDNDRLARALAARGVIPSRGGGAKA
jgi:hypothetical protein